MPWAIPEGSVTYLVTTSLAEAASRWALTARLEDFSEKHWRASQSEA